MKEGPRELAVRRQSERFTEQPVLGRIERQPDRFVVGESRARQSQNLSHRRGQKLFVARFPVDEPRDARAELPVELFPKRLVSSLRRLPDLKESELGSFLERHWILKDRLV